MSEELLTPTEVATWLKVSRSWVYSAAQAGTLPAKRIGRAWRFSKGQLERWLAERDVAPVEVARLKAEG